jgi:hypothetical protein
VDPHWADGLVASLEASSYAVNAGAAQGLALEAYREGALVVLSHNLGSSRKPSRLEAAGMLESILRYGASLAAKSAAFGAYLGGKALVAELYVFSGHMDFKVARLHDGRLEFYVELE